MKTVRGLVQETETQVKTTAISIDLMTKRTTIKATITRVAVVTDHAIEYFSTNCLSVFILINHPLIINRFLNIHIS